MTAFRFGSSPAALRFMLGVELPVRQMIKAARKVNIHRERSSKRYISAKDAADFLVKQDLSLCRTITSPLGMRLARK